jgi:hypothetical protein
MDQLALVINAKLDNIALKELPSQSSVLLGITVQLWD